MPQNFCISRTSTTRVFGPITPAPPVAGVPVAMTPCSICQCLTLSAVLGPKYPVTSPPRNSCSPDTSLPDEPILRCLTIDGHARGGIGFIDGVDVAVPERTASTFAIAAGSALNDFRRPVIAAIWVVVSDAACATGVRVNSDAAIAAPASTETRRERLDTDIGNEVITNL